MYLGFRICLPMCAVHWTEVCVCLRLPIFEKWLLIGDITNAGMATFKNQCLFDNITISDLSTFGKQCLIGDINNTVKPTIDKWCLHCDTNNYALLTCVKQYIFSVMPYYGLFSGDIHILDLWWRSPLCSLLFCGYYPCVHYFYVP